MESSAKPRLLNPCIYLSSISWSFLRATSHCCSPIVWSISSQGISNMAVSGPLPPYWLATSPAACWPAQRIHSSVLGFKGQFLAPVSLFFRTGQLGNKVSFQLSKKKCGILQEQMPYKMHFSSFDTLWQCNLNKENKCTLLLVKGEYLLRRSSATQLIR